MAAVRIGPVGGTGGQIRDIDIHGVTRLVWVKIMHGQAIDSITFKYMRNGHLVETTNRWGGGGGVASEIDLSTDEYLTNITGHYGHFDGQVVMRSLRFYSNKREFPPCGKFVGEEFQLPAPAGNQIIGFHARSGKYLDGLGIYVAAVPPNP